MIRNDRVPVILSRSAYDLWLDPGIHDPNRLEPLLVPISAELIEAYQVGRLVNDTGNDVSECIRPIDTEKWLPGMSS
jgi:putative SOS response-associated peptidase YedK